ncbi:TonB-dependent siderophore receptor [Phyllobacterium sp. 21LDTY02-6]|uniref:TonB-dependent siderophore receptor n=1 Tax=Phyllobacterium sp. 21LDTY02-6 TaxID=2944903 RepID=UPI0020210ED8|nr:TonB-dependent siderophore receptor [Phyllobacterium sp. 21LDTY02-6]MCO4318877.1 TonB-dependent siderophore receptor [Phyllobacterium sp. 21LDTY02-6]
MSFHYQKKLNLIALSFCGLLYQALPATAQDDRTASGTINLEPIIIQSGREASAAEEALAGSGPVDGYVATGTTTGSKTTTPIIEIPQSISVITRDQLDDRNVQTLGQALGYSAGVIAEPFGNDVRYFNPLIRGFEGNDSVYLNSFRFIRDFGALAFEPYGLERIEVLRGPSSVLYGQGEPGGMINLISKRPTFTDFVEVGGEIGTDSRYVGKVDAGGTFGEDFAWRLNSLGRLADGDQDFITDDRFHIAPSVTWAPTDDTALTILGSFQRDTGTSQVGLPQAGTLDFNPHGTVPINRYLGEPDFNDNESSLWTLGYEFRHRFDEVFEFRQNAQYLSFDADFNNLYFNRLNPADLRTVTRGASVQSEELDSFGIDNQLEAQFETGLLEHKAVFGIDYRNTNQWRSSNFTGSRTTIDLFNPVYGTPITYDPARASISDVRLMQTGLYVQDQIKIDRLSFMLGLRQDWAETRNHESGTTQRDHALTGRAGAVYLFDNGLAPFVSYSTSFAPQAGTNDITGDLLQPTEGEQIEAGIKYQPAGKKSFITASVYNLTKTNIASEEIRAGFPGAVTTQIGEVRSRGFEIEGVASLAEGLDLLANYTYTDAEITQGDMTATSTTGNRPANIPRHAASLWLDYTFAESTALAGFSVGGGVRYIGSRYGENANAISLPSVTLFDAGLRYEKNNFTAAINVHNIADERYVASCNFGCFYGEGRSVIASFSHKW